MANPTATQTVTAKPATVTATATKGPHSDPIQKAMKARQDNAARRAKLTPQARFREDLMDQANRIADLIDGQRGALIGIVSRGLPNQKDDEGKDYGPGLSVADCQKALAFIRKALDHVEAEMVSPTHVEERFTL